MERKKILEEGKERRIVRITSGGGKEDLSGGEKREERLDRRQID